MAMTRKHYIEVANIIHIQWVNLRVIVIDDPEKLSDVDERMERTTDYYCDFFARDNNNFDVGRFKQACTPNEVKDQEDVKS